MMLVISSEDLDVLHCEHGKLYRATWKLIKN